MAPKYCMENEVLFYTEKEKTQAELKIIKLEAGIQQALPESAKAHLIKEARQNVKRTQWRKEYYRSKAAKLESILEEKDLELDANERINELNLQLSQEKEDEMTPQHESNSLENELKGLNGSKNAIFNKEKTLFE